jgi:hypothetical protein
MRHAHFRCQQYPTLFRGPTNHARQQFGHEPAGIRGATKFGEFPSAIDVSPICSEAHGIETASISFAVLASCIGTFNPASD